MNIKRFHFLEGSGFACVILFGLIIFQFFNLMGLEGLYSEDDYWIRNTLDGHLIQSLIDKANGRFVIGTLTGFVSDHTYQLLTGKWIRAVAQICILMLLAIMAKHFFSKNLPAMLGLVSIAFLHPYWIDLLRFNLLLPGVIIATLTLLISLKLSIGKNALAHFFAAVFLFMAMGVYQPYLYFYIVFILIFAFVEDEFKWIIVLKGFLVALVACAIYALVYSHFKPVFLSDVSAHDSPIARHIVSDRSGFLNGKELLISLLESFYHGIRTLFLPDGAVGYFIKAITLITFLVFFVRIGFKAKPSTFYSYLFLCLFGVGFIWFSSTPIHGFVREDHYAFRSMVQASILIAFMFVYVALRTKFYQILTISIAVLFGFSSFMYVNNIKLLYENHVQVAKNIEAEYKKQELRWDIYKIETPQRYTKQFQVAHKGVPYVFSPLWHNQTKFEFLKAHTSLPIKRFVVPASELPSCQNEENKLFWFLVSDEKKAVTLCFKSEAIDIDKSKPQLMKLKKWLKSL